MQRRLFLQALAASAIAVGAPLPVGFPQEALEARYWYALFDEDGIHGHMTANHPYHLAPDSVPAKRLTEQEYDKLAAEFRNKYNA